jgi:hypothetical protein
MKKFLKIVGALIVVLIIVIAVFIATFKPAKYTDYGYYAELAEWATEQFAQRGMQKRPVSEYFENFYLDLGFPFSKIFGASKQGVQVISFENEQLSAATVSMFELPPGSGYYSVFTLNLVPRYGYKAPILHVDFMKPSAGVSGMFILDFFNVDTDNISVENFLGKDAATVKEALALVEQYQRTEEQGRGEISRYLDPFKSSFRFELQEPKTKDNEVRKAYYTAAYKALKMVLPVYLKRMAMVQQDRGYAAVHEEKMNHLAKELYTKDFAVKMGKNIFKEHLEKYWAEGMWNVEMPEEPEK